MENKEDLNDLKNLNDIYKERLQYLENLDYEKRKEASRARFFFQIGIMTSFTIIFGIFSAVSYKNPDVFLINDEAVFLFNKMINAFVIITIPFIFGAIASATRILLNRSKILNNIPIIIGSGIIASFSWIGIKSNIILSIILTKVDIQNTSFGTTITESDFYTMVFLSIIIGMFSSNFYLLINEKIENITKTKNKRIKKDKKNK